MVAHDPKSWFAVPYRFHRSDTLRRLFYWIVGVSLYAGLVAWLELEYWQMGEDSRLRIIPLMHALLGFVISF